MELGIFSGKSGVVPLNEDHRILEARKRLAEVQLDRLDIEKRIEDILNQKQVAAKDRKQARADAYLEGRKLTVDELNELDESLSGLKERLSTIRIAEEKQKKVVGEIEQTVSREICAAVLPEYKAKAKNISKALISLYEAVEEERELYNGLRDQGVAVGTLGGPAVYNGLSPQDIEQAKQGLGGRIYYFYKSCIEDGFLEQSDVPPEYRELFKLEKIRRRA